MRGICFRVGLVLAKHKEERSLRTSRPPFSRLEDGTEGKGYVRDGQIA